MMKEEDRVILWYVIIAARTLFVQYWRREMVPAKEEWVIKLVSLLEEDKIKSLNDQDSKDYKKTVEEV